MNNVTPREFLDKVVRPNIKEFYDNVGSEQRAYNAVAAVDSLSAHIYVWCKGNAPQAIADIADDMEYRESLAKLCLDFRLLRDIAKVQKHVHLTRGKLSNREVTTAAQVTIRSLGWDEAMWDESPWDGPPNVVVTTDDGHLRYVTQIVAASLAMLEIEMTGFKI